MQIIYPQLDGIKINENRTLPVSLIQAIRKAYDYITGISVSISLGAVIIQDTHANRSTLHPPSASAVGSLYFETDRGLLYLNTIVSFAPAWVYLDGIYTRTQAQLAAVTASLTANDNGLLINVSDYSHVLKWTNPALGWGPGEFGSGMLQLFAVAPGTGWAACNGAVVAYLKADGTTATVTLPNTAGTAAYAMAAAAYSATITAAQVPTISQPTFSGSALSGHAHQLPTRSAGATTFAMNGFFGTAGGAYTMVGQYVGAVIALANQFVDLTESVSGGTPAGTVSQPTATLPGDPIAHFPALLYFRQ